tara:strand:+ start:479 stop:1123 length:645 start_codon:yes stop_codon:yes gene_type:complete
MSIIITNMPYQPTFKVLRPYLHDKVMEPSRYIPNTPYNVSPPLWRALLTELLVKTRHIHNNERVFQCPIESMIKMHKKQDIKSLKLTCREKGLQVGGKKWELIARIMAKTMYGLEIGNWDKVRRTMHQKLFDLSVMVAYHAGPKDYGRRTGTDDASLKWTSGTDMSIPDEYGPRKYGFTDRHLLALAFPNLKDMCERRGTPSYIRYYCGNKLVL